MTNLLEELLAGYAIARDRDPVIPCLLKFVKESREYGYPVASSIANMPKDEQRIWAMRLLLYVASMRLAVPVYPIDQPTLNMLLRRLVNGPLFDDAEHLIKLAVDNSQELRALL